MAVHQYGNCPSCRKPVPIPNPAQCPNSRCKFTLHSTRRR